MAASISPETSSVFESHLAQISEHFKVRCVRNDPLVTLTVVANEHVEIKLQCDLHSYPAETVIRLQSKAIPCDVIQQLQEQLASVASFESLQHIMDFLLPLIPSVAESPQTSKQVKKKKGKPQKQDTPSEKQSKKPPMKTAIDVISRLQWDESLQSENFTVGYLDRFIGIVERKFDAFDWGNFVDADIFSLAVPRHRIEYFKYFDLIVWCKRNRRDLVFGSQTDKRTITEAMEQYDELLAAQALEEPIPVASRADDEDDEGSSDDDGVTLGDTITTVQDSYWENKLRPNYFIAIRVTNKAVQEVVSHIQDVILGYEPDYESCYHSSTTLHITLCTLRLDFNRVPDAAQALERHAEDFRSAVRNADGSLSKMTISGLDTFYHRVLFAKVSHDAAFEKLHEALRLCLAEEGISMKDLYDFVPHMTLLKVSRPVARIKKTIMIDPLIYKAHRDIHFGEQYVESIHLCSMEEKRQDDGFYTSACDIQLT